MDDKFKQLLSLIMLNRWGIIPLFVAAFGSDGNENRCGRKNWSSVVVKWVY